MEACLLIPLSQFFYFQNILTTPKICQAALGFMSQTFHFYLKCSHGNHPNK